MHIKAPKGMCYDVIERYVQNGDIFLNSTIGGVYGRVCIQRRVPFFNIFEPILAFAMTIFMSHNQIHDV